MGITEKNSLISRACHELAANNDKGQTRGDKYTKELIRKIEESGVTEIPQFDDMESFLNSVNDLTSLTHKIDVCCALINIPQKGRGELSSLLMIKNAKRAPKKCGDVRTFVDGKPKDWELKEESGHIGAFCIPNKSEYTTIYNRIMVSIGTLHSILTTRYSNHICAKMVVESFPITYKITEFNRQRFQKLQNLYDTILSHREDFKLVWDLIEPNLLNVDELRRSIAAQIIKTYSGGYVVWRKARYTRGRKSRLLSDAKYQIIKPNQATVKNLTLGNIQLMMVE